MTSLSVRTYEASNENGPLEEFVGVDPAVETVMDLMRKVLKSTQPFNPHIRDGMRLHAYVDHEPGDVISDPQAFGSTLEELRASGRVQYEEDRRGLHLKVLVDGCRTEKEAAEYKIEQSWRSQYEAAVLRTELAERARDIIVLKSDLAERTAQVAALTNVVQDLTKYRDFTSHLMAAAILDEDPAQSSFKQFVFKFAMQAAEGGNLCELRALFNMLLRGNDVANNDPSPKLRVLKQIVDKDGTPCMHSLAKKGQIGALRVLVQECGADLKATDNEGGTPLHAAAANGQAQTVRVLVRELGADPNVKDTSGKSPLHLASALNGLSEGVMTTLVRELGADPNAADNSGMTPVHLAAGRGFAQTVRVLVQLGADPKVKDKSGRSALHAASESGHTETVRVLGKVLGEAAKAEANTGDVKGWLPLFLAAYHDRAETVAVLVQELGANVQTRFGGDSRDGHMESVLDMARRRGCRQSVSVLGALGLRTVLLLRRLTK